MRNSMTFALSLALAMPMAAQAGPVLIAQGTLGGTTDLSGLSGTLENGLAENFLGGVGSGLTYAGGNTFLGVPDRGPNATPYNSAVDDTLSWIARFHTLDMSLTPSAPGADLPFVLTSQLKDTKLLYSPTALNYGSGIGLGLPSGAPSANDADHFYFSGRSDNYGAGNSLNLANARMDPEAIRLSNDGKSVFISDEYGPYVRQFDRESGELIRSFELPENLAISQLSPRASIERSVNTIGRYTNSGMEGLAITPDGTMLVGAVQGALLQDRAYTETKTMLRLVTIDIATGQTTEYGYMLTTGTGVSEIIAINDHQFLVGERDGTGLGNGDAAKIKQFFVIDLSGATPLTTETGAAAAALAVAKSPAPFLDLVSILMSHGIDAADIPSKIEGMAFGQDVWNNGQLMHTLWISDDNDFLPDTSGDNHFYVFGFTDEDLPGFVKQALPAVPEPASWALMIGGFASAGMVMRRRKTAVRFA